MNRNSSHSHWTARTSQQMHHKQYDWTIAILQSMMFIFTQNPCAMPLTLPLPCKANAVNTKMVPAQTRNLNYSVLQRTNGGNCTNLQSPCISTATICDVFKSLPYTKITAFTQRTQTWVVWTPVRSGVFLVYQRKSWIFLNKYIYAVFQSNCSLCSLNSSQAWIIILWDLNY